MSFTAREVDLTEIHIWPDQPRPRTHFTKEKLAELEASIKADGIQQPINLRPRSKGGFTITAGERRFTAAKNLGLAKIPAVIGPEIDDAKAHRLALIENIQRQDLNPAEEFLALQRHQELDPACKDHRVLAGQLGVPVSHVKRIMKLGKLHKDALAALGAGAITFAHVDLLVQHNHTVQQKALKEGCFYEIFEDADAKNALKNGEWSVLVDHMAPVKDLADWLENHATVDIENIEVQERIPELAALVAKSPATIVRLSEDTYGGRVPKGVLIKNNWTNLKPGEWKEIKAGQKRCDHAAEGVVVHGGPTRVVTGCWSTTCKTHNPSERSSSSSASASGKKAKPDPWVLKQRREEQKRREWGALRNASWPALWPTLLKHASKVTAELVRGVLSASDIATVTQRTKSKLTDQNALAFLVAGSLVNWRNESNRAAFARVAKVYGFDLEKFARERAKSKKDDARAAKVIHRLHPKKKAAKK